MLSMPARPSVRLSVCPVDRQQQRRLAGLLLSAPGQETPIDSCGCRFFTFPHDFYVLKTLF